MGDQLRFELTTGLDVRLPDPPPWVPSTAAAHVMGLSKALAALDFTRAQIVAAYEAETARLKRGGDLRPVTVWRSSEGHIEYLPNPDENLTELAEKL